MRLLTPRTRRTKSPVLLGLLLLLLPIRAIGPDVDYQNFLRACRSIRAVGSYVEFQKVWIHITTYMGIGILIHNHSVSLITKE